MKKKILRYFKTKSAWLVLALILLAGVAVAAGTWGVGAKYATESSNSALAQAKEFYFTSDLLAELGAEYTLNANTENIVFHLYDSADSKRNSEVAVSYVVSYTVDGGESQNHASGKIEGGSAEISIPVDPGKKYVVTAVGSGGYQQTLSATFTVAELDAAVYQHLDTTVQEYVMLTVWTKNVESAVTVQFPNGLIPDATDEELKNLTKGANTFTRNFGKYEAETYRFFKSDPTKNYTIEDFTVTAGGAEVKNGDL